MNSRRHTAEEVARRGEEIYERSVRERVEPEQDGCFLALDILSGDYEVADEALPATARLRERRPDAVLYLIRVGRPAAFRMRGGSGGSPAATRAKHFYPSSSFS